MYSQYICWGCRSPGVFKIRRLTDRVKHIKGKALWVP